MAEARHAQRILELEVTADESDDTLVVTAMTFYRDRQSLEAGRGFSVTHDPGAAAANHEVELGEVIAFPNVIRLVSTFQA